MQRFLYLPSHLSTPQPCIEEQIRLYESHFLRELDNILRYVSSNSEAMLDTAIQGDLVWLTDFPKDVFRLMALGRWKYLIGFCQ